MPPKPKKGKAAKGKKKVEVPLEDIDTTVLTKEKLEHFCVNIYEALKKEKQHSDFLRLDRDKLTSMVAISRQELVSLRNSNRAKNTAMMEFEDNHRRAMGQNRQKLINLACEKNIDCLNTKQNIVNREGFEQKCHEERMSEIRSDIENLKTKSSDLDQILHKQIISVNTVNAETQCKLREKNKTQCVLMENKRDKFVNNESKKLNEKFDEEYRALEKRKVRVINQWLKYQFKFTNDLKFYYEKTVHNNLTLLLIMKTSCQQMKSSTATVEKQLSQLRKENTFLKNTLKQSKSEEKELRDKLASSQRDQSELKYTKKDLMNRNQTLDHLKWELETLHITLDKQDEEARESRKIKQSQMIKLRSRIDEFILMLEYIVSHVYLRINEADTTLAKIKKIYQQMGKWHLDLEFVPAYHDTSLDNLNYQLTSVIQERDRVLHKYKQLLNKYSLHMEDTGFVPVGVDDILNRAKPVRFIIDETQFT